VTAVLVSMLLLAIGIAVILLVGSHRPIGTPLTWGEAFVGATWVFALMLIAYGIIPHQWLAYADNELLWRADKLLLGASSAGVKFGDKAKTMGGSGRILINYQAIRDIIAATIYIVFLSGQVWLWAIWQKRGRKKPEVELSSAFGRPVVKA